MTTGSGLTERPPAETGDGEVSARLQERIRAFTSFYEEHAYLAYNLALRIVCVPELAMSAVQAGFLAQLQDRPAGLVAAVVDEALHEASSDVDPSGAGDVEAQRLMSAIAALAPAERAAVALADLTQAGPEAIAPTLDLEPDSASKLLHRAREGFAARLGLPRAEADQACRDWMWAVPPNAIWEELYPRFHQGTERHLRKGIGETTLVLGPDAQGAPTPARRPRSQRRRRLPWRIDRRSRSRRATILVGAAVLALAGVAVARLGTHGGTGGHRASSSQGPTLPASTATGNESGPASSVPGAGPIQPHKPLTPAELDKLRLRELRQLNRFTKRQANNRLSPAQRNDAARGIAGLQHAADHRLNAELRREQVLRDQLARERAKANAPPPPPPPSAPRRRTSKPSTSSTQTTPSTTAPSGGRHSNETCLLDQDTGQYICPQ